MSSTLCQMPQPCLDPWLIEPHVSKLKSTPPKSNPSESFPRYRQEHQDNSHTEKENNSRKSDTWSFVQSLTNNSHNSKELLENEKIYVHPLTKHFASTLSMKSLEMCTESLGSETGSDISDEYSPLSLKIESSHSRGKEFTRKPIPSRSFPPPLTTISGSDSVRVRLHREGGRLVIKVVKFAASDGYFQADRVDGRLRLCLVKNNDSMDYENNEEVDEGESRAFGYYGEDVDGVDDDGDMGVEGIRGNSGKVEGESGIGEIQRPSRCKEGDGQKRMSSLGPFLKALC